MHFGTGKVVTCFVALVGQHGTKRSSRQARQAPLARHVFRGVATAWIWVNMSASLFQEVVREIDANPEHKRLNLYMRALLLLRRPPRWNKHGATRTTRYVKSRHTSCVSCRDATSGIWAILITTVVNSVVAVFGPARRRK